MGRWRTERPHRARRHPTRSAAAAFTHRLRSSQDFSTQHARQGRQAIGIQPSAGHSSPVTMRPPPFQHSLHSTHEGRLPSGEPPRRALSMARSARRRGWRRGSFTRRPRDGCPVGSRRGAPRPWRGLQGLKQRGGGGGGQPAGRADSSALPPWRLGERARSAHNIASLVPGLVLGSLQIPPRLLLQLLIRRALLAALDAPAAAVCSSAGPPAGRVLRGPAALLQADGWLPRACRTPQQHPIRPNNLPTKLGALACLYSTPCPSLTGCVGGCAMGAPPSALPADAGEG